jgi:riboflavin kinase/FMN adenylyltransferase
MKIYKGVSEFTALPAAVVTSGTFDGVHIGHQKILKRLRNAADALPGGETVLLTFWPHPRLVLHSDSQNLKLLSTFEEKAELLAQYGVDHLVKIPFTKEFASLSSEEFIRSILIEGIGTKKLVIGYDHRFGRNREGSYEHLVANQASYGFTVEEIPRQDVDNIGVSSTRIRQALLEGQVETATEYLGRPYALHGQVVGGLQLGRQLGYPTANLQVPESYKLIPSDGVYAVRVQYNGHSYGGMLNIGHSPTVGDREKTVEVHLFDFSGDLYNKNLRIDFIAYIRQELKFDTLEALRLKIQEDEVVARRLLDRP